ncbi:MAG: hypothetical protein AAF389_07355 [Gemmatimonadota bacterium]
MIPAIAVCTVLMAASTPWVGWLAVPLIGCASALVVSLDRPALTGFASGALAWGVLLLWGGTQGPVGELAGVLGGVLGIPSAAVFGVTLLFPAMLGAAAGGFGGATRRLVSGRGSASGRDFAEENVPETP